MQQRIKSVALLVALALSSCSDNDSAIFFALENEVEEVDYSLPNESHVLGIGRMAGSYYVSLGPSIWKRVAVGGDWDRMTLPPGLSICTALSDFGGLIYAGTPDGIATWDGSQWTTLADPLVRGAQISSFFKAGAALFVCTYSESDGSYALVYTTDGASFAQALHSLVAPVAQLAYDGGVLYAVAGSTAYRSDTGPESLATFDAISGLSADRFGGILYHPASDRYLVSTTDQYVYSSTAGDDASWTAADADEDDDVGFTRLCSFGDYALAGTLEHGLFRMAGGDDSNLERWDHSTSSDLYTAAVRDWFVDPDDPTQIFALTSGSGLWRTADPGSSWIHE